MQEGSQGCVPRRGRSSGRRPATRRLVDIPLLRYFSVDILGVNTDLVSARSHLTTVDACTLCAPAGSVKTWHCVRSTVPFRQVGVAVACDARLFTAGVLSKSRCRSPWTCAAMQMLKLRSASDQRMVS
ncbi:unnamed protein product [Urochloa humidicola]